MRLEDLVGMASALRDVTSSIEEGEKALKSLKDRQRSLKEEVLPLAMEEIGLKSFTLDSGETISVSEEITASIPAPKREDAYLWLKDKGFGGLIKTQVTASFDKGGLDEAVALSGALRQQGLSTSLVQSVHHSTLKAFVKEQLKSSEDFPMDLFGVYRINCAHIA